MKELFLGRRLYIATQHRKEQVIAPLFIEALGVSVALVDNLNTDALGTFSGEIDRKDDPMTTLRKKCQMAFEQNTSIDLVVASEGSFGPHPALVFVTGNTECVMLIDQRNHLEISTCFLSTETNHNARQVKTWSELLEFALKAKFPSHGLILRPSKENFEPIFKGIVCESELRNCFDKLFDAEQGVYVETDMRALYNPTRMKVIEQATHQLIRKIQSTCPQCSMPGYDVVDIKRGLTCASCGLPTDLVLSYIYRCQHCGYEEEHRFPNGKTQAEPQYCSFCNP